LSEFYQTVSDSTQDIKIGAFALDEDSLGNEVLLYREDSSALVLALNFNAIEKSLGEVYLKRIIPNESKTTLALQYQKVGSLSDFVFVVPFGSESVIDSISKVYSIEWLNDSTMAYAKQDEIGRAGELYSRGILSSTDSLLFTEEDKTFDIEVFRDDEHLFCTIQSKTENEIYLINANPVGHFLELLKGRESGVQNTIKAFDEYYLLVSDENRGTSILRSSFDRKEDWQTIAEIDKNFHIVDFSILGNRLVVSGYEKSISKLKFMEMSNGKWQDPKLKLGIGQYFLHSKLSDPNKLGFTFSSPAVPSQSFVYHFDTEKLTKREPRFELSPMKHRYNSVRRMWAKSYDGTAVPITVVNNGAAPKGSGGLILKVYGAYGANTTPGFYADESILMQQGHTIAYAHVRGESILGADWYKEGRVLQKKNSILDYLACAEYLIKKKLTTREKLIGYGNSAGGLVVAQAANLRPDLFNTIILDHPYLDVVNTIMNDTLPLTIDEYKEWGNPNESEVFDYIMGYSPYQNIEPQHYPNVLLAASYQDFQTPVWQIAKYAAKLRENNLGTSLVVLRTDMNSGHMGSRSGKEWIKDFAEEYSFVKLKLGEPE
ncbi:MAG TPA: prolyl oligopeptidase family serine peptidase, partial [Cryomorphaceae bacterium]|nr:prolyl oligopeptidase family serine peptidase [Cryomorphaceae bacterium]